MPGQWIIIGIVSVYLITTSLIGFLQSRKVKHAREFIFSSLSAFQAATFLAGFSLGGVATYGVAGDTIKFGLTYLVWFPISIAVGWWITGICFAKPYFKLKGTTLPALIGERFNEKTRSASTMSMMVYSVFVIIVELYTLSMLIQAVAPILSTSQAVMIGFVACILTVAFSGMMGASVTNLIHTVVMLLTFSVVFISMLSINGGWGIALHNVTGLIPSIADENVDTIMWLSPIGMGWGVVGQIMLAKAGRLGGISAVSNLAASCRTEKDAKKAFWWAGFISAIPPFLSCSIGILTAAFLGTRITEMPVYAAIGYAVGEYNPFLAGIFLAAIIAGVLSTFSALALSFSSVFIEDIVKKFWSPSDNLERWLYPISIIVMTSICAAYIILHGVEYIMPFVFSTAFPCTIPNTLVALFGVRNPNTSSAAATLSILLGVSISLIWGLLLDNPFNIPNIYVAFLIPFTILSIDTLIQIARKRLNPIRSSEK